MFTPDLPRREAKADCLVGTPRWCLPNAAVCDAPPAAHTPPAAASEHRCAGKVIHQQQRCEPPICLLPAMQRATHFISASQAEPASMVFPFLHVSLLTLTLPFCMLLSGV